MEMAINDDPGSGGPSGVNVPVVKKGYYVGYSRYVTDNKLLHVGCISWCGNSVKFDTITFSNLNISRTAFVLQNKTLNYWKLE